MTQTKTRALTEGALLVAAATALSYVKLFELPQGGSVCIGMLPIFLYCARWGCKESFLASFAYGLLQLIFDGAYAWGPTSMLFDYVLAYGVLGVACLFRKQKGGGVYIGTVVGCLCRFLVHFISGITIYRIYEPTELFNTTFANPYIYSAAYNGSYMVIDLVLCLVITALLYRPLSRYFAPQETVAAVKRNQSGPAQLRLRSAAPKSKRAGSLSPPTDCRESRSKRNGSPAFYRPFQLHRCADGGAMA